MLVYQRLHLPYIYGFHVWDGHRCHQCSHQPPGLGIFVSLYIGRNVDAIWKSGYKKYHHLRPYQQTPKGAQHTPNPQTPNSL